MASVNKVIIVGNLTRDPEEKVFQSGDKIANVTVATSDRWRDKNSGEQKESTEFHRVVFRNQLAEIVLQYLRKGSPVYLEGKLATRKYTDQSGKECYSTEIQAHTMQMLGGKSEGQAPAPKQAPQQQRPAAAPSASRSGFDDMDDTDIPFSNPMRLSSPLHLSI